MARHAAAFNQAAVSKALTIIGMFVPKFGLAPVFGTATLAGAQYAVIPVQPAARATSQATTHSATNPAKNPQNGPRAFWVHTYSEPSSGNMRPSWAVTKAPGIRNVTNPRIQNTNAADPANCTVDAFGMNRTRATKMTTRSKEFTGRLEFGGDALKRPPSGFDPEHPLIDDLKRKDVFGATRLTQRDACSRTFLSDYGDICRAASPLIRFVCKALDLPF